MGDTMNDPFRVIARYGSEVDVARPGEPVLRAHLRRRNDDVVCGDLVFLEDGKAAVARRAERENHLVRRDGFNRLKTIAANIDRAWIVVALRPETPRLLIDRFLVGILNLPARAGILINKSDLLEETDGRTGIQGLDDYRSLDIPILSVSAHTEAGLDALRAAARGSSNILVGPSGAGKSSLIQALLPRETLRVGALGETGEGRHTTTTARWYETGDGAAWIDSPGVRDFSPEICSLDDLARGFPDIAEIAQHCRFRDCTHRAEPDCAVRAGASEGRIAAGRMAAWLELFSGMETARIADRDSAPIRKPNTRDSKT
jgi:ribosome biogenesis GTPase / thiamine phosphate phosphatase